MTWYAWDEAKRVANLQKHGIDFRDARAIFEGHTVTIEDDRQGYGEQRFVTFGLLEGTLVAVVHTDRDDVIRIISIRKAARNEEKIYFAALGN
jgi:uncharacterized protein